MPDHLGDQDETWVNKVVEVLRLVQDIHDLVLRLLVLLIPIQMRYDISNTKIPNHDKSV